MQLLCPGYSLGAGELTGSVMNPLFATLEGSCDDTRSPRSLRPVELSSCCSLLCVGLRQPQRQLVCAGALVCRRQDAEALLLGCLPRWVLLLHAHSRCSGLG